jgi:hypothetical protein
MLPFPATQALSVANLALTGQLQEDQSDYLASTDWLLLHAIRHTKHQITPKSPCFVAPVKPWADRPTAGGPALVRRLLSHQEATIHCF